MTKRHFDTAAEIVNNIRGGLWTNDRPSWADTAYFDVGTNDDDVLNYTRAAQTAEAFIMLFRSYNPRFDENRFLVACGLVEAPVKKGRNRAASNAE